VEEVALAHNISQLRKALRDTTEQPRLIETVPKRGYRFIAAVRQVGKLAARGGCSARGGILPSMLQNFRSLRPPVWAAFAACLCWCRCCDLCLPAAHWPHSLRRLSCDSSLAVLPLEKPLR